MIRFRIILLCETMWWENLFKVQGTEGLWSPRLGGAGSLWTAVSFIGGNSDVCGESWKSRNCCAWVWSVYPGLMCVNTWSPDRIIIWEYYETFRRWSLTGERKVLGLYTPVSLLVYSCLPKHRHMCDHLVTPLCMSCLLLCFPNYNRMIFPNRKPE